MCWVAGQLLGTGVLRALVHSDSQWSYRLPFALQWAWAVPLLIGVYFAPESPCKPLRRAVTFPWYGSCACVNCNSPVSLQGGLFAMRERPTPGDLLADFVTGPAPTLTIA